MLHSAIKPRQPGSIEDAVVRAAGLIGYAGIEEVTGKSESLARKWADPDCDQRIAFSQALQIDMACKAAEGETPLGNCYWRLLEAVNFPVEHICIVDATLSLHTATGRISQAVQKAKAPTGPGGRRITDSEKADIVRACQASIRQLEEIIRACDGDDNVVPMEAS